MKFSPTFKHALQTIGGLTAIMVAIYPYINLKAQGEQTSNQVKHLQNKVETDHDVLIRMSTDISYIKDEIKALREDVKKKDFVVK